MKIQIVILLSFFSFFSFNLSAKVWINEFMQSNVDELIDDLQDFPDSWIELYNDSDEPINLLNWYVSDKKDFKKGWRITKSVILDAKSYQIIYCDKAEEGIHTSFRLDSGNGGDIYLFDPNGNLEDSIVDIPRQPAPNVSCGRIQDAGETWAYFVEATPNEKNEGITSNVLLPSPIFSLPGGVYQNALTLSFSLPEGVPEDISVSDIYYTLDGSEPTKESNIYEGELTISTSAPIRAKLISPNYLQNRSATQTYIISGREMHLPVIAINLDPMYLWDDEFGIYVAGNGKYGIPGNGRNDNVNWNNAWRRPMNVEYFPVYNEKAAINQLGELRIAGGWSRSNAQKSLILYTHKRFGNNRFNYTFFKEKPNQQIKSFMIRNSGNDWGGTFFKDAAIQLFMGNKVDLDYQAYQPAIIYLNGEYYGMQNLRERSTDDFVFANYNGLEDIDMIERVDRDPRRELKAGDWVAYNDLMSKLSKPTSQIDFDEILRLVDVNEYMNYIILQTYVGNTDFPNNNLVMWRPRTADGKWRYILKDTDFGLDDSRLAHNTLSHYISSDRNDQDKTLLSALLTYEPFKTEFYSRFAIYMGDILSSQGTSQVIDSIRQMVEPEMLRHRNRWRGTQNLNNWNNEVGKLTNWCSRRNNYVYTHLANRFSLLSSIPMVVETQDGIECNSGDIVINGIPIQNQSFDGRYFRNKRVNISWTGDPEKVNGWLVTATDTEGQTNTTYLERDIEYLIPTKSSDIRFTAVNSTGNAIPTINKPDVYCYADNNQLVVRGLQENSVLTLYSVNGNLVFEAKTTDSEFSIPLREKGMYILRVKSKSQTITEKIKN